MADRPSEPGGDPRLRDYLAAELREAEVDFPLMRLSGRRPVRHRLSVGILGAAVVALAFVGGGSMLLGAPGPTESPTPSTVSVAPASVAPSVSPSVPPSPSPTAPLATRSAEPSSTAVVDGVDCALISPDPCAQAIALARTGHKGDVRSATLIVVMDSCPPNVLCDRKYPFDSAVVFVTAGGDTTGWYAFHVFGLKDVPTTAEPWPGELPAHVVQRIRDDLPAG